jgi:hypothetical protein
MKNILKIIFLTVLFSSTMISCVNDEETDIPYVDNPLFKESFNDNFPTWVKFSEVGTQVWESAPYGNPDGFCAKMSGYSGSSNANIDWLISPAQDLSSFSKASFAFESAVNFSGPNIEIYISKNYSGAGDPNAAGVEWNKVNGSKLAVPTTPLYQYFFSGIVDVPGFAGTGCEAVYFAFKYTSTTSQSATWEIDNFKVYGTN